MTAVFDNGYAGQPSGAETSAQSGERSAVKAILSLLATTVVAFAIYGLTLVVALATALIVSRLHVFKLDRWPTLAALLLALAGMIHGKALRQVKS